MNLFEAKKRREEAIAKCEAIISATEKENRSMTQAESENFDATMKEVNALAEDIKRMESLSTIRNLFPKGQVIPAAPGARKVAGRSRKVLSAEYLEDFAAWAASRGKTVGANLAEGVDSEGGYLFPSIGASLTEGVTTAGGFAVPSQVEGQIVPLAPPQIGVRNLAQVIPTVMDLRFPRKTAHGTAALKAEGANFGGTDPVIDQFTLSAFMVGHIEDASWELLQDVPQFQAFMQDDILLSIAILNDNKFVNGSGIGEPQGLIGNVGAGVTCATHAFSDILDSSFDVLGALNAIYHPGASWLMQRATSVGLRKAQKQSNLFEPIFTRVGNQDYLHGYPVEYSDNMPANGVAAKPILFGDFKRGYIIGERGGAGVNVKILDQTKAVQGLVEVLGYLRVDGRVRRSEAIQTLATT